MKKFIQKLIKVSLPLVILISSFLLYAEYTLYHYPSTFQLKANYFKENKSQINILVLGSSHNKSAINPEFIKSFNCSNLAFGGQSIKIDSALLDNSIKQLPKLKYVIFELSYHTLEHENALNYHRNNLYLRFYDINLFNRKVWLKDYSIYLSEPNLYNQFLNPLYEKDKVNKYGFPTKLIDQRFEKLNYDKDLILKDTANIFIKRHKNENVNAYLKNTKTLRSMIAICIEHKVVPIIISPPVYKTYYRSYLNQKENRRRLFLNELLVNLPELVYFNYEQKPNFKVTDFRNEDHLNPDGAKKFSILLEKDLLKLISSRKTQALHSLRNLNP